MKYISVEEAGKKLGLSARRVRNYCAQGRIPGAVLNGKTWFIPYDIAKPSRSNGKENFADFDAYKLSNDLIGFINKSPVAFYAVDNVSRELKEAGYVEIFENERHSFFKGKKCFVRRNDSSLIAINVGKNIDEKVGLHIIASHADSPCFKIKPDADGLLDKYNKINLAPYGGLIASTWLDRPLGISGRVLLKSGSGIETRLVNFDDLTILIPNLCIHFNREVNKGYEYNMAVDMQAFMSQENGEDAFITSIAKRLNVKKEDIVNFDLYAYNKERGVVWGEKREYVSSPRLDDLECVYLSQRAFKEVDNENAINVLYITDNEEVGSLSRQGADSDFLKTTLAKLASDLKLDYNVLLANSFLVSADNAHAVHPNKPQMTDSDNKAYMNRGLVIKFNAAQSYTSDALSSAVMQSVCEKADVPYQFFTNRSDLRGGSTLANLLMSQVSVMAVDVGLPQLAMHSSFETAGSLDVVYGYKAFKSFYESKITFIQNTVKID